MTKSICNQLNEHLAEKPLCKLDQNRLKYPSILGGCDVPTEANPIASYASTFRSNYRWAVILRMCHVSIFTQGELSEVVKITAGMFLIRFSLFLRGGRGGSKRFYFCWFHTKTGPSQVGDVIAPSGPWSTPGLFSRGWSQ